MSHQSCFVTTSENVLFKLMKDKKHPQFKFISKLNKEPTVDTLGFNIPTPSKKQKHKDDM